jgi:hypothetical protein
MHVPVARAHPLATSADHTAGIKNKDGIVQSIKDFLGKGR